MKKYFLTLFFIIFSCQILAMKRQADSIPFESNKKRCLGNGVISSEEFCALVERGEHDRLQEMLENNPNLLKTLNFHTNTDIVDFAFKKGQHDTAYMLLLYSNNKNTNKSREICKNKYNSNLEGFKQYLILLSNIEIFKNKIFDARFINLSNEGIPYENIKSLAIALRGNDKIVALNLCGNEVQHAEAQFLFKELKTVPALKLLNLSGEPYEDKGAWNEIADIGAIALAELLKVHTGLIKIKIDQNLIGKDGMCALIEAFDYNTSLMRLDITDNSGAEEISSVTPDGVGHMPLGQVLEKKLERNRTLHRTMPTISTMMLSFKNMGIPTEIGKFIGSLYFALMQTTGALDDENANCYDSWVRELEPPVKPHVEQQLIQQPMPSANLFYWADPNNGLVLTFNPQTDSVPIPALHAQLSIDPNGYCYIFDPTTMLPIYPYTAQIQFDPHSGWGTFYHPEVNQEPIPFFILHPTSPLHNN